MARYVGDNLNGGKIVDADTMRILRDHMLPKSRKDSYEDHSESFIRYLKNVGLLDCYYDYVTGKDMIFTTDLGKEYVELQSSNASLDELRDIVLSNRNFSRDKRYRDAVEKAIAINTY